MPNISVQSWHDSCYIYVTVSYPVMSHLYGNGPQWLAVKAIILVGILWLSGMDDTVVALHWCTPDLHTMMAKVKYWPYFDSQ